MLRDRRALLVTFAGKEAVRDYVAAAVRRSVLTMTGGLPWSTQPQAKPNRLAKMINIAKDSPAQPSSSLMDLYHRPDRVVVGELTSYPAGGDSPFETRAFQHRVGPTLDRLPALP